MKALFILPNLSLGGAERMTLRLVRDLTRRGTDAGLFLLRHEGVLLSKVPQEIAILSAGAARGQTPRRSRIEILGRLLKCARQTDVVIGALELMPTYLAYLSGLLLGKPVIGWVHTSMGEHLKNDSSLQRMLCGQVYRKVHKVVIVSPAVADSLASIARISTTRLLAIPSYVDVESLMSMTRERVPPWAKKIADAPLVVTAARLAPEKGLDILIKAHARLNAEGLHHNVAILGEGPQRAELERLAGQLNVRSSVLFPGYVANPFPLIKAAAAFVLPSRYEGFPLVLLEALGVGAPIVTTDCPGGSSQILDFGKYGIMVPPEDERALAEGISRLMTDQALTARFRSIGPRRAREFSPESSLLAWEGLFAELQGRSTYASAR